MVEKYVEPTGESSHEGIDSPPPVLAPVVVAVELTDAAQNASGLSLGSVTVPSSYLYKEPKQVLGCVVFRQADNWATNSNCMTNGIGQVQAKNAVSGTWTQLYTFTSGQIYVGSGAGTSAGGDVLIGTTPVSGLTSLGTDMCGQMDGPLELRLVSAIVAYSGVTLRDVRVGLVLVY